MQVVIGVLALALGAGVGLAGAWWLGLVVALVAAAAVEGAVVAPRLRGAEDRVLALVGPVRPPSDALAELRLLNLVEGLAPNAGVPRPRCLVIDDDTKNSLVIGRGPRHGCIVVTSGLLDGLSRMELEAVVAHAVVRLRDGATAATTTALALGGARWLGATPCPPGRSDLAAVALTRYPPGLVAALGVIGAAGPAVPNGSAAVVAPLWIAAPSDPGAIAIRVDALEEL
ncbi:MAG: M48 family metalloprotease [Acidimicrobiales bacterium]